MLRRTRLAAAAAALVLVPATAVAAAAGTGARSATRAPSASDRSSPSATATPRATAAAFTRLERRADARLGVVAIDTGTGRTVGHRADERFAFASTVKVLQAGVALRRLSAAQLDRTVRYDEEDVLEYAPVTDDFVETGLPLRHLINASLQWSDNTAANLIVERLGGTDRLERDVRRLGDRTTSIDRDEPELNTAIPGDVRDTTTPHAMAANVRRLLLGDALRPDRRRLLRSMMLANTTGDRLIRAGVPDGWTVADKTGSASYGTRNDVAVAWPRRGKPVVIVVFTTHTAKDAKTDDALVAAATRTAVTALR